MNKPIGAFEAKTHFSELLERAERGEEIVITKRGKAVARLMPMPAEHDPDAVLATLKRLGARAKSAGMKGFDWNEWKRFRDEGRR